MNVQSKKSLNIGSIAFWLTFAAYAFSYLGRNTFSACLKTMGAQGLFDEGFDGYVSAAYLIMYGSGQLINGILITKFSPKYWVPIGLFGSGLINILMTVAGNQYLYLILWALNGFCCSMLWPSVIAIFTSWLGKSEREKAAGNISPSIPVGSISCYLISFFMLKTASENNWKYVFILSGSLLCLGALLWTVSMFVFSKRLDEKAVQTKAEIIAPSDNKKKFRFTIPFFFSAGLLVMLFGSFFNGSLKEAVIAYVPTYISDSFDYTSDISALISTLLPVFAVAGPYFGIFLNKKFFDNEAATIGALMGISAVCNFLIFITGSKIAILSILMIAISTACMWGVNNMLMTFTPFHFAKLGASSIVSGILNGTVFIGSAIFTVFYRNIANSAGWNMTVLVWTLAGVAAAILCFALCGSWKKRRPD